MKILSVNVAEIGDLFPVSESGPGTHRRVASAIHKQPVGGAISIDWMGLEGDDQAEQHLHGGRDKAVYAYPIEHYDFWSKQRSASRKDRTEAAALTYGALGENLTIEGLLETDLWIGDRLAIGSVILEVTEPRHPCFKLTVKMGFSQAAKAMIQSGFSGFYLRVIQTGALTAGDAIELIAGSRETTLQTLNERRRIGRQPDLF